MRYFFRFFASTRLMAVLLVLFFLSIATATFVENDFGTAAARKLFYNAKWFEILLLLGTINIILVTVSKKMYERRKLTQFVFHISFIIIIIGAGITRYFGEEGIMHIREGGTSDIWYSSENNITLFLSSPEATLRRQYPVSFASVSANRMKKKFKFSGRDISFKVEEYLGHGVKSIKFDRNGQPLLHVVTSTPVGRQDVILAPGELMRNQHMTFIFDSLSGPAGDSQNLVRFYQKEGSLYFRSPVEVSRITMSTQETEILKAGTEYPFIPSLLHYFDSIPVVLKQYMPSGKIVAIPSDATDNTAAPAVRIRFFIDDLSDELVVFGIPEGQLDEFPETRYQDLQLSDINIGVVYGAVRRHLPFSLRLNDFILKRYPGSQSPEWFESNVQLVDPEMNIDEQRRIFMNNTLKHKGYRFYQSSYDSDELGTILSVNRDKPGTLVTYAGYILLALGMFLSLFNRNSRFMSLSRAKNIGGISLKVLIPAFLFLAPGVADANDTTWINKKGLPVISEEFAMEFSEILVHDIRGRIEPLNTLASEVLRKLARKEEYKSQGYEQVFLGMWVFPEAWQHEKMIRVGHPEIQKLLGLNSKYAAFVDFFDDTSVSGYLIHDYVENAYRKKPGQRSKFDNEMIRVDERLNVAYMLYSGDLFRIFPDPDDTTHHWYSPSDAGAVFSGKDSVFTRHIITFMAEETRKSVSTGNYDSPLEMVNAIKILQGNYGKEVIPSKRKTEAEIFYNKSNLLVYIMRIYMLVGFIFLIFQFIQIFLPRFGIRWVSIPATAVILVAFLAHAAYLALRWYIAEHAPWSNGFEALTFIAWVTVLAGLIFSYRSNITVSTTAVLSGFTLMTAHLSWMDPQVTPLVPVLQSYWLIIHVAVITASYAFLGLGALLAFVNLILMFFHSKRNYDRLDDQLQLLTGIIEMTLIAGIYLLTIGTFLGGVWANESWGRYWAWDPKETWALATIIVYAVILHLRLVPGLKGRVLFNILSLIGFGAVMMTYFGVNYYLSGLHSYAKGDPVPVPAAVYYTLTVVFILCLFAAVNQYRLRKSMM